MSQEAFDGCDGVLKDESYKMNPSDPTVWTTFVFVPERSEYYVGVKASQTFKMWESLVCRKQGGGNCCKYSNINVPWPLMYFKHQEDVVWCGCDMSGMAYSGSTGK